MTDTEQIPYQTYRDGVLIDSGTLTRTLTPGDIDQRDIVTQWQQVRAAATTAWANVKTADDALQAAATTAAVTAAVKQLSTAQRALWTQQVQYDLLVARVLKYVAGHLDTGV